MSLARECIYRDERVSSCEGSGFTVTRESVAVRGVGLP